MRVLQIAWEYPPHIVGGMGYHIGELAPALAANGITVGVISPRLRDGPLSEQYENLAIVRVPPPLMSDYEFPIFVEETNRQLERAALQLRSELGPFDLIHVHDWLTASAGVALKHRWRIPLIATIHATERGRGRGRLSGTTSEQIEQIEWRLAYEAWKVIVCSEFMADEVGRTFSVPRDKVAVVPNGVRIRPSPFQSHDERLAFRRRFVDDHEAIVFYVGRLVYEKGIHDLIAALPQILAERPVRLIIAGTGSYLDELRGLAARLGLSERVIFTGFVSDEDRDRLYHVADVGVFPSIYEPFGIVALEGFATECPVVVTQTGGLAEVVRLHDTGIVVYPNNPGSVAWGILHTLNHPEWTQARVANAMREVRERYTWAQIAHETAGVFAQVQTAYAAGVWGHELALPGRS